MGASWRTAFYMPSWGLQNSSSPSRGGETHQIPFNRDYNDGNVHFHDICHSGDSSPCLLFSPVAVKR